MFVLQMNGLRRIIHTIMYKKEKIAELVNLIVL